MRIALAQLNIHIGNFEGNVRKMLDAIETARAQRADLICFSELATCGYPPRDFLEFSDFIAQAEKAISILATAARGIAIVVGSPSPNPVPEGKDLFNSAYFLSEGTVKHITHKTLLPTYDIFDEDRYFEPGNSFSVVEFKGARIAVTVCEDIWNINNENPLYAVCPLDELMPQQPDLILNLSASPFDTHHAAHRREILAANALRYELPIVYVNHVGAQTELIFDGGSMVMGSDGQLKAELPFFQEHIETFDIQKLNEGEEVKSREGTPISRVHDALILGVRDYFRKLGLSRAIVGLSGGIDSAVVAVLAARALGPENLRVVLLPSPFSSDHSIHDALQLADNLGIRHDILSISETYETILKSLHPLFENQPFGLAEENIQARIRGLLLMAISNKFGPILLNTTNKSEMAVGYGTLYGDMCGGLSVIGDVYKTDVYRLATYMNAELSIIPSNILSKPPSAELRPDQKDIDSLPPYDILDAILFEYIENRKGPSEIATLGFDPALIQRVLKLVNTNEFKRYQAAPVLRVSSKAFGMGRRMPIVGKYLS